MIAILRLEAIGDNHNVRAAGFNEILRHIRLVPEEQRAALFMPNRRPWVARITGADPKYGLSREFLKPKKDFSGANAVGSRGVEFEYTLREGHVYEVLKLVNWHRERRYFARVLAGRVVELSNEEIEEWKNRLKASLSAGSGSTS